MSRDMVYEDVPRMSRRVGDNVVAGANNSTIVLGRDRIDGVDSGYGTVAHSDKGTSAGSIHLVVGRKGEDFDFQGDAATLYLSQRNDPDTVAETGAIGSAKTSKSAIVGRADCMRMVSREDFKLSVGKAYLTVSSDGKIVLEGDIQLGADAADRIIRGDKFAQFWLTHTHPTAVGPSGPPPPIPEACLAPRAKVK